MDVEEDKVRKYVPQKIRFAREERSHKLRVTTDEIDTTIAEPDILDDIKRFIGFKRRDYMRGNTDRDEVKATARFWGESRGLVTVDGWWEITIDELVELGLNDFIEER